MGIFDWLCSGTDLRKELAEVKLDNGILKDKLTAQTGKNEDLLQHNEELQFQLTNYESMIADLRKQIPKPSILENYWNTKRPQRNIYYRGRPLWNKPGTNIDLDVRLFINLYDNTIPTAEGATDDEKALNGLKLVISNMRYTPDKTQFNIGEFWQFAFETLKEKAGDCEDGAILLYNILLKSGIPYWKIRLNAGNCKGGGHCWLTYLRESDNSWVILDWCYWPDLTPVTTRRKYKDMENYFDIWFSWNQKFAFNDTEYTGIMSDKIIIEVMK